MVADGHQQCAGVCRRSLVALDELGRGTATMDGVAIASAVLTHVVREIGCRGVFATHYHSLADRWAADAQHVAVKHMACQVEAAPHDPIPRVRARRLGHVRHDSHTATCSAHPHSLQRRLRMKAASARTAVPHRMCVVHVHPWSRSGGAVQHRVTQGGAWVQVVFQYLLSPGPCPKSYGPSVARAAGVPDAVARRAVEISEGLEQGRAPQASLHALWRAAARGSLPELRSLQQQLRAAL
jgi:DNA mismatch repair ATPase MutS